MPLRESTSAVREITRNTGPPEDNGFQIMKSSLTSRDEGLRGAFYMISIYLDELNTIFLVAIFTRVMVSSLFYTLEGITSKKHWAKKSSSILVLRI